MASQTSGRDIHTASKSNRKWPSPSTECFAHLPSSMFHSRALSMSCRKPEAGTGIRQAEVSLQRGGGWVQPQRSTRHPLRWAGGARVAIHKKAPWLQPTKHAPRSYRTFSSPAWMRGWPEAQHEALLRSLLVPWCSELPAGSACGGNNRSNPECCPLLTRRSPSQ